jgi:hypothetical protein
MRGYPAAVSRFSKLEGDDVVRPERLPAILWDSIKDSNIWRSIWGYFVKG